jgi:hypothetical protein
LYNIDKGGKNVEISLFIFAAFVEKKLTKLQRADICQEFFGKIRNFEKKRIPGIAGISGISRNSWNF